jgi:hypothetical protein
MADNCLEKSQKTYFLPDAPYIINMKLNQVYINKYAPCPNEQASFDDFMSYWQEARVLTHKLIGESYGCWELKVSAIDKRFFESRHELDILFLKQREEENVNESEFKSWERISIRRAISLCRVQIMCNMDYYFEHASELEADLGRQVNIESVRQDAVATKILEQELFYKHMCKLFGAETENEDDDSIKWSKVEEREDDEDWERNIYEKVYMIKEFTILILDGNYVVCSARRGQSYLLFNFTY